MLSYHLRAFKKSFLTLILSAFIAINYLDAQPKVMVGIVVDQMRYEYLQRFNQGFGEGGFRRLLSEGTNCHSVHFNYVPTYTGPGHASIYTGTTPSYHGIVGNSWFDRKAGKVVNCVSCQENLPEDLSVGQEQVCPDRMNVSTIADELKLRYGSASKVYSIALKDRGAVLPGGHMADGAFWFDGKNSWTSSAWYMKSLPDWVEKINQGGVFRMQDEMRTWELLLDDSFYPGIQANKYEPSEISGFPKDLYKNQSRFGEDIWTSTPFGNTVTTELALALLNSGILGSDTVPDLLAISYSSPDLIGHTFGPYSSEVADCFYRLDREIAQLLTALDTLVGKDEYIVFLTTDHGVANNSQHMKDAGLDAESWSSRGLQSALDSALSRLAGKGNWTKSVINYNIYFDSELDKRMDPALWRKEAIKVVQEQPFVFKAFTRDQLMAGCTDPLCEKMAYGYNPERSGDIVFAEKPGWVNYGKTGSSHGSGYSYDTHAPLIWYGKGIPQLNVYKPYEITDIAPTASMLLGISVPGAATGRLISEIFENNLQDSLKPAIPVSPAK